MQKCTLPSWWMKDRAASGMVLLLLGLLACEKSATAPGLFSDLCLPFPCPSGDPPPLYIHTRWLPHARLTVAYSQLVDARGGIGNRTWSVTGGSLPTGLSLTGGGSGDGLISGTPTSFGTFHFTAQVTSGDQSDEETLSITVGLLQVLHPSERCSDYFDAAVATFEDVNLEAAIRAALGVGAQEDLICGLISGVTELDAAALGIVSVVGIQNLTSLSSLNLQFNSITNISALSGLPSLRTLDLSSNSITDISWLSGLTSLTNVDIRGNAALSDSKSCNDVARLEARGVTVQSDCP